MLLAFEALIEENALPILRNETKMSLMVLYKSYFQDTQWSSTKFPRDYEGFTLVVGNELNYRKILTA